MRFQNSRSRQLADREVEIAIALVIAMAGVACHRDEDVSAPPAPIVKAELPADLSIELERMECYGTCPCYVVKIGATGSVEWEGRDYVDVEGAQVSQISIDAVRALFTQFDGIGFAGLHDYYNVAVTDLDTAIVTLRSDGEVKRVSVRGADEVKQGHVWVFVGDENERDDRSDADLMPTDEAEVSKREAEACAKYGPTFLALDDLAAAIDRAANTAQWIGTAPKKRHR